MSTKMRRKIIKDITFHELWLLTEEYKDPYSYTNAILTGPIGKKLDKCRLTNDEIYDLAKSIYKIKQKTFKDILNEANKTKAQVSHMYCIPIRTVEDWYAGKSKCPDYMKIMLLKQFHNFYLGKYIVLESDIEYRESLPGIYEHSEEYEVNKILKQSKRRSSKTNSEVSSSVSFADSYHHSNKQLADDIAYVDRQIHEILRKKKEKEEFKK